MKCTVKTLGMTVKYVGGMSSVPVHIRIVEVHKRSEHGVIESISEELFEDLERRSTGEKGSVAGRSPPGIISSSSLGITLIILCSVFTYKVIY